MTSIDVIIPTWNGRHLLEECLRAVQMQERTPDGIIVVDNASSDGTASWLAREWPQVRTVSLGVNRGFAGAVREGIERSQADIVALLNNDARPRPGWLAAAASAFGRDGVGSCASAIITPTGVVESAGLRLVIGGVARRHLEGRSLEALPPEPVEVFGPSGGAALYLRQALNEVGGFDDAFFAQDEDIDVAFRLRYAGYICLLHPRAVVVHLGGQTLKRDTLTALWLAQRNLEWAFWLNMPWWSWPVVGPIHLVYQGASLLRHVCAGRGGTVVRAKWEAFRSLPLMQRRRMHQRGFVGRVVPWLFVPQRRYRIA